jgi:F-type H+-transporting ATPase subunit b
MLDFSVTFIITILNIVILFFILRAILFKPVSRLISDRTRRVKNSIEQAEADTVKARNMLLQYEKRIASAEAEAEGIIKAAHEQAEIDAGRILSGSKKEAERIIETARVKIETDRLAAMALFKTEAAALVLCAAGRLLEKEISGTEQQLFAAKTMDKILSDYGKNDV